MEKEHLEIILEDIRGKFELVLEGHDVLHKEIRDTRQELCEKISLVDFKVDALSQRVDGIDQKVDSLSQRLDCVEANLTERIDGVESKLTGRIDGVESTLNRKIDAVEVRLTEKIDAMADDLKAHRADTEAHRPIFRVKE